MQRYFTMKQAAEKLGVSAGRVRQMVLYPPDHPQYLASRIVTTELGDTRRVISEAALVAMLNKRQSWWETPYEPSSDDAG